ncbi:bifunctional diguanylate cyclase/phosphodiesterase [Microbacterium album]|uniref:Uncharacterized protein n=1 Tax=Microbacterium album TaxID=2053191 RepID=A0A917MN26_9MICO|nr:bifunctional diguanylate cyclase/phosphodiesterase [Microbacterium album]GGH50383.1 hypothetical protein GCM10010921_29100 [Microbacterium album]
MMVRLARATPRYLVFVASALLLVAYLGALAAATPWPALADDGVLILLTIVGAGLSAGVRVPVSSIAPAVHLGIVAALLGAAAPEAPGPALLLAWSVGVIIGLVLFWGPTPRVVETGAAIALGGLPYLLVWRAVTAAGLPDVLACVLATAAYVVVRLAIPVAACVVRGSALGEVLRSLSPGRIATAALANVVLTMVARAAGGALENLVVELTAPQIATIVHGLVGTVALAIVVRAEAIAGRVRLDAVLAAARQLPWPEQADDFALAREYAAAATGADEVRIAQERTTRSSELSAAVRAPGEDERFLVVTRRRGRPPFRSDDARALEAVASMATETLRVGRQVRDLRAEARTDPLTGLPNYHEFQSAVRRANETRLPGRGIAVLSIDLAGFKAVSAQHGRDFADRVLQVFAERLRGSVRPSDTVARVGDDEFGVVFHDLADRADAELVAGRLLHAAGAPFTIDNTVLALTVTSGLAYSAEREEDPGRLVRDAGDRSFTAPGVSLVGGQAWSVVTPLPEGVVTGSDLSRAIRESIDSSDFGLAYQPIVDNVMGTAIGLEALLRCRPHGFGDVSPTLVVHEARRLGRLDALTGRILERVHADAASFRELAPDLDDVHVNVEVDQVLGSELRETIRALRAEHPGTRLTLELTENSLGRTSDAVMDGLQELRELGVVFALDDFGQAYSTMLAIVEFPFDVLKIDRALIRDLSAQKTQHVIRSLALLSRKLNVRMVVEGVETIEERDRLARLGVRYMQGYFFQRPVDADVLRGLLRERGASVPNATRPDLVD